jgi:hypothetical protein
MSEGEKKLLVSEKSRKSGRNRAAEKIFHVELASTVNLSESLVIVEDALLRVKSVQLENGWCRSISEWM